MLSRTSVTRSDCPALADNLQPDLGVDRAAHLLDGLNEGEALHGFVVEIGDDVVGHDAGLGGGRVIDRETTLISRLPS